MSWPTTNDPRTEFVTVRFTKTEADDLDWLIGATNAKNRSAAVRSAVDRVHAAERRRAAKQTKAAATTSAEMRSLADAPDE